MVTSSFQTPGVASLPSFDLMDEHDYLSMIEAIPREFQAVVSERKLKTVFAIDERKFSPFTQRVNAWLNNSPAPQVLVDRSPERLSRLAVVLTAMDAAAVKTESLEQHLGLEKTTHALVMDRMWAWLQDQGVSPETPVPSVSGGPRPLWEALINARGTGSYSLRIQPPLAFQWARAHQSGHAYAVLRQRVMDEVKAPTPSILDGMEVMGRWTSAPDFATLTDRDGTSALWWSVHRQPAVLKEFMEQWKSVPEVLSKDELATRNHPVWQVKNAKGEDLWMAALTGDQVQDTFNIKSLSLIKALLTPAPDHQGRGWLVAHPEMAYRLASPLTEAKGGVKTNHAVRKRLHQLMKRQAEWAWAGSEDDHRVMGLDLWMTPQEDTVMGSPSTVGELCLWALPVPPGSSVITPALRGTFIRLFAACLASSDRDLGFHRKGKMDAELWGASQRALASQRLNEHLSLPHEFVGRPDPLSSALKTMMANPAAKAHLRAHATPGLDPDVIRPPRVRLRQ